MFRVVERVEKQLSPVSVVIRRINKLGFVAEERAVIFECDTPNGSLDIEFALQGFYRLIALSLQLLGRLPDTEVGDAVLLKPDAINVMSLGGAGVGLEVTLPGGAPLTFQLDQKGVNTLISKLAASTEARVAKSAH